MTIAEKKILNLLESSGLEYELFEHEPVYTCEQAAEVRGVTPDQGIKCLLLKSEAGFVLALTRGDRNMNLKKIAELEGVKKVKFANDEEIQKIAECPKGCVHPFCDVGTYFDKILLNREWIEFNPGCHDKSVRMKVADLVKLIRDPIIESIGVGQNNS